MSFSIKPVSNRFVISHRNAPFYSSQAPLNSLSPLVDETAQKTIERSKIQHEKCLSPKTATALSFVEKTSIFSSRLLEVIPSIGPNHSAVSSFQRVSLGISALDCSTTLSDEISDLSRSKRIGDEEGCRRTRLQIFLSFILVSGSILDFIKDAFPISSFSPLNYISNGFYGIASLMSIGTGAWAMTRCSIFRSRINKILGNEALSEKVRMIEALRFLKEKATPTKSERDTILKEVRMLHPNWDTHLQDNLIERKILDFAEVKMNYVKRRTDEKVAERILQEVDTHLNLLTRLKTNSAHLNGARKLIEDVKSANKKKILFSAMTTAIATIGTIALFMTTFPLLGSLSLILYTIASTLSFLMLVSPWLISNIAAAQLPQKWNAISSS